MNEMDYLLIDKKIDGTLTPDEVLRFERKLAQDADFAKAYELQQTAIASLQLQQHRKRKTEVRALYESIKEKQAQRRKLQWYSLAAALAVVVISSLAYITIGRSSSPEALFAQYYTPYPVISTRNATDRSPTEPSDSVQAILRYAQEDYSAAIPLLEDLSEQSENIQWKLLLGNAYLKNNQHNEAITSFQQVASLADPVAQQYGRWYLALALLKVNQPKDAQTQLETITQQPGLYQTQAQTLLDEL